MNGGGGGKSGCGVGGVRGGKGELAQLVREGSEVGGQISALSRAWGCSRGDSCRRKRFGAEALAKKGAKGGSGVGGKIGGYGHRG